MKQALKTTLAILAATVFWSFAAPGFAQEAPKPMRGADVAAVDQAPEAKKYLGGKPGGQEKYCADAPRCTLSRVEGAKHEILQERDELRNLTMSRVVKFFDAQVTP